MPVIVIPKPLRDKLGEDASDAFVSIVREVDSEARQNALALAEERFERRLAEVTSELLQKIAETKAELIKWMFVFWISQIGILAGLLFAFLKGFGK